MQEKDGERDSSSFKKDHVRDLDDIHDRAKKQEADLENGEASRTEDLESGAKVQWTFKRCVAIAALCGSYVGSQIPLYFVGGALTYIAQDLALTLPQWLPNANLIGIAATLPFVGYFTDLIGRRWTVIGGAGLLIIGCILVATAQNFVAALFGMTFAGIGAGICEMVAYAGVAEITPVKKRGMTIALVTVWIIFFCPYVLYVQLLQEHSTWRWALGIAGFWNFVSFAGLIFCYHPPPRHVELSRAEVAKRIDYVGAFLSIGGLTLFLAGVQAGGLQFPWSSGKVLGPLIVGIVMIIAFVCYEVFIAKYPMVPGALFKGQRVMTLAFMIAFIAGMNFYSILNFFPLLLEYYYPPDPILVGERAMGYGFSITIGAVVGTLLMSYTNGHVRTMITFSCVVMTAFGAALAAATPFNPGFAVAMSTIGGIGIGGVLVPSTTLAIIAAPDDFIATATALALAIRFVGGAIGNSIYFNIYNNKIKVLLPQYLVEYATKAGLPPSSSKDFATIYVQGLLSGTLKPSMFADVPGVTAQVLESAGIGYRWAFVHSVRLVWYTSIAFGVIACVCCMLLPNIKKFMTNRVAVDIH